MSALDDPAPSRGSRGDRLTVAVGSLVAFLAVVEVASGVVQGYYTPLFKDLAVHLDVHDADLNWFESAQLVFSALVVPPLARLADLVGHRRVLVWSTVVTAAASWAIAFAPTFETMLVAWSIQGAYVIWLPIEVALIHQRTRGDDRARRTRRASAILVGVLQVSIIVGALTAGALAEALPMRTLLAVPAVVVTLALIAILVGVADTPGTASGGFDGVGTALLVAVVGLVMGGVVTVRLQGLDSPLAWGLVLAGLLTLAPWVRWELGHEAPLVDLRALAGRDQWPVQATAALLGVSILGAQVPLSVFGRADPDAAGYGWDLTAAEGSVRIAVYVAFLAVGALLLPLSSRLLTLRGAMVAGAVTYALGYLAWIPVHDSESVTLLWLVVIGIGSGTLVAAIPAAAVAAAPEGRVGQAAGLTNAGKTIGGGIAAAVFAIVLSGTGSIAIGTGTADIADYYVVWAACGGTGLLAAVLLLAGGGARRREVASS